MPDCLELSDEELNYYVSQGWVQEGGPYDSQNDCVINCGSSSSTQSQITVSCCSVSLPGTLHVTNTGSGPSCTCINGMSLVYDSGTNKWTGSATCGGSTVTFNFYCLNAQTDCLGFALDLICDGNPVQTQTAQPGCSCSPLSVDFNYEQICGSCILDGGSGNSIATVTI